jgi:hypothetical protein
MSIAVALIALSLGGPAGPILVQGRPDAPGYGVQPPGYGDPQSNGAKPEGYGGAPGYGDRPPGYGVSPGYGAPPAGYGRGLDQYGHAPPGYGVAPQGYGVQPPSYGATPRGYGAPPPGYGVAPGYGQAPAGYGVSPGYGSVPRESPNGGNSASNGSATNRGTRSANIPVPSATPGVRYHFDPSGRFLGATETIDNTTREYDATGRVIRTFVRDHGKVVVFDADGRAIQHTGGR